VPCKQAYKLKEAEQIDKESQLYAKSNVAEAAQHSFPSSLTETLKWCSGNLGTLFA